MIRIVLLAGVFMFFEQLHGQTGSGGIPMRMQRKIKSDTALIDMPPFDSLKVINENDSIINKRNKGFRISYNYKVNISPANAGSWYELDNHTNVWSATIRSKKAYAIGLVFNNFVLKPNEKIFVYTKDEILGAFTKDNNMPTSVLAVIPLNGEEITIEFSSPYNKSEQGSFYIETVAHVYQNLLQDPGLCNIDINCPEGANWQTIKRAVCKLIIYKDGFSELCSGVLMNNTALDAKPFILTAQHCLFDNSDAARTVFYFNYESPFCNGPIGNQMQTLSGSQVRSTIYDYDFTLLECYQHPPMGFKPYMAGWSLETANNLDTVTCIHHPWGGNKKIAISNAQPIVDTYTELGSPPYATNAFWRIAYWNHGVTEKGSSGGPLFDRNYHVIGTLTGGDAECGNPINDYFERLIVSYQSKANPAEQLKYWLNPKNLSITSLDGYNPFPFIYSGCDTLTNIASSETKKVLPYEYGKGYYSGQNSDSITKYAEKFSTSDSLYLSGVLLNINSIGSSGGLIIRVYEGGEIPDTTIYENYIPYGSLTGNTINYVEFYPKVTVKNNFFIGYEISYQANDTFNLYQAAPRYINGWNSAYLYANNSWVAFDKYTVSGWGSSFDIQPLTCNTITSIAQTVKSNYELQVFPCPASKLVNINIPFNLRSIKSVQVYTLTGSNVSADCQVKNTTIEINVSNLIPGFYIARISTDSESYTAKFIKAR